MTQAEAIALAQRLLQVYQHYQNTIRDTVSMSNKDQWFTDYYPWLFGPTSIPTFYFPGWLANMTVDAFRDMVCATWRYVPEIITMALNDFELEVPECDEFLPEEWEQ